MSNSDKAEAREFLRNHGWIRDDRIIGGKPVELWRPVPNPTDTQIRTLLPFTLESAHNRQQELNKNRIQANKKRRSARYHAKKES